MIQAKQRLLSSRSQDWFSKLSPEAKLEYAKKFPKTKFVNHTNLKSPNPKQDRVIPTASTVTTKENS